MSFLLCPGTAFVPGHSSEKHLKPPPAGGQNEFKPNIITITDNENEFGTTHLLGLVHGFEDGHVEVL